MATNLGEIKNDVLVKLNASTTLGFYTDDILNDWVDLAHKWAAGYKKWPHTEGKASTTFATSTDDLGDVAVNYPEGWRADSIRYMIIGGKEIRKKEYRSFRKFRENYPGANDRIFTDYGRVYYINPNADVSGTLVVFGQYTPAAIDGTDPDAVTVFSGGAEEVNEAIIQETLSYAKRKEQKLQESVGHHQLAQKILDEYWERLKDEQHQYQVAENDGVFKRFDVLEGGYRDDITRDQF